MSSKYRFTVILCAVLLLQFPVRVLIAEILWSNAFYILDDQKTGHADIVPIDEETYPGHRRGENLLNAASVIVSSQPRYSRALGDLLLVRAKWTGVMEDMRASLPEGSRSSKEYYEEAEHYYREALRMDLTDAGTHVALGHLYDQTEPNGIRSEQEYERAVMLDPVNVQLRYAVAIQHLLAGRNGLALEHAGVLVRNDETGAYFMHAMEIVWRASRGDEKVVKGLAIQAKNGEERAQRFLMMKGTQ